MLITLSLKSVSKILNGLIITSGQEFFEHYGMEFRDTGEVYKTGDNAGKPIRHVIIDENHGLPTEIKRYFYDNYSAYLINFVIPDTIAFYLANGHSRNCLSDCPLINHINSAIDIFNVRCDIDKLIP